MTAVATETSRDLFAITIERSPEQELKNTTLRAAMDALNSMSPEGKLAVHKQLVERIGNKRKRTDSQAGKEDTEFVTLDAPQPEEASDEKPTEAHVTESLAGFVRKVVDELAGAANVSSLTTPTKLVLGLLIGVFKEPLPHKSRELDNHFWSFHYERNKPTERRQGRFTQMLEVPETLEKAPKGKKKAAAKAATKEKEAEKRPTKASKAEKEAAPEPPKPSRPSFMEECDDELLLDDSQFFKPAVSAPVVVPYTEEDLQVKEQRIVEYSSLRREIALVLSVKSFMSLEGLLAHLRDTKGFEVTMDDVLSVVGEFQDDGIIKVDHGIAYVL